MAKRIWIDGYEANVPQRVGSGQVAFELLKNLEQLDQQNDFTIFLPNSPLEDLPAERPGWRYQVLRPHKLWTLFALPLAINTASQKPDVFFSPTHYIPQFTNVKRVVTIFDTGYFHYPQTLPKTDLWKLKNWTKYSVSHAQQIITISESAKKDISHFYHTDPSKITVAYPGFKSEVFKPISDKNTISKVKQKYGVKGDYLIFLGTIQPRKNLVRLIEAFKNIDNLQLVIVGKTTGLGRQGWKFEEILNKPKEFEIEEKIIFVGFVPYEDVVLLLNGALAFVLPSLWEGFGIPVVDAMACGKPVIVSNVSALPEVAGEAGLLVNPLSVAEITQAVKRIVKDDKLRSQLSKKALVQAGKFSWRKMARQVLAVLEKV